MDDPGGWLAPPAASEALAPWCRVKALNAATMKRLCWRSCICLSIILSATQVGDSRGYEHHSDENRRQQTSPVVFPLRLPA